MFKYSTESAAKTHVHRATKIRMIVLGDDGKFWVVSPREAARLERQGYEVLS